MTIWINIYTLNSLGAKGNDKPILRVYHTKEEALRFKEGCIKTIEVSL